MQNSVLQTGELGSRLQRPEVKKKLTALIVSALVLILNDIFALGISSDTLTWLAGLVATYMLGQGMADIGKERAIIQAKSGMAEHMEIDIDMDADAIERRDVGATGPQQVAQPRPERQRLYRKRGTYNTIAKDNSPFDGRAFG